MPFLTANGIRTYYEVTGIGDLLVLLHNDALSLDVWRRLIPHLAARHRVIAYDRRGHGQSQVPPRDEPYTVEVLADDLRGLLDGLEIPEADFFGYSGGAITALGLALAFPVRVRRLILAEPPILGFRQDHPIDTAGLQGDAIARVMQDQGVAAGLDYWFAAILPPRRGRALLRSRHRSLLLSRPAWVIEGIIRSAEGFNPTSRLAAIRQPVLLILGEKSHPHFASIIDVLVVNLPRATRLTLTGTDHSTLLEPSDTLLSAVRSFPSTPVPAA